MNRAITALLARRRTDNGFPELPGGSYRPAATAWAILCLEAHENYRDEVTSARARLKASQTSDGSIPLSADHPEAFWPTFPGALALSGDMEFKEVHDKAIGFILSRSNKKIVGEDGALQAREDRLTGWPWIDQTYAWVEPTAMAVKALVSAGLADHDRTLSGVSLLLDRQLPKGGWNYGNTLVFEQTLNPMPGPTGMALWALDQHIERSRIVGSLEYLQGVLPRLVTPLSLGWALLGLSCWNVHVRNGYELAADCLARQERYGTYSTTHIATLLYAIAMLRMQEFGDA